MIEKNIDRCLAVKRSALLINSKLRLLSFPVPCSPSGPSTSLTYASKSSHLKRSGFRASTICTTRCDRSITRQSCRQTSMLRSNGVSKNWSCSCSLHEAINNDNLMVNEQRSTGRAGYQVKKRITHRARSLRHSRNASFSFLSS